MVAPPKLLTIIGPTACGKTALAAAVAARIDGEIISGDSRQVYRGMDLGTGKDLCDYSVDGKAIPYHCIDVVEAGTKYNVYEFQRDFITAFRSINNRNRPAILCGGTGMYIEAVLKRYKLLEVPADHEFRAWCETQSSEVLEEMLRQYKDLHNHTDTETRRRLIRALEIERYYAENPQTNQDYPQFTPVVVGVQIDRDLRRHRIESRLEQRLQDGMLDEVRRLLNEGVDAETLIYYGLEYKFVTWHIQGILSYSELVDQLTIAIQQFAKRQMTWFRGMERRGTVIHWIDGALPMNQRVEAVLHISNQFED